MAQQTLGVCCPGTQALDVGRVCDRQRERSEGGWGGQWAELSCRTSGPFPAGSSLFWVVSALAPTTNTPSLRVNASCVPGVPESLGQGYF